MSRTIAILLAGAMACAAALAQSSERPVVRPPILRPLSVDPQNPRFFNDGTRGVYLAGHQIFVDLQDNSFNKEWTLDLAGDEPAGQVRLLDWSRYLALLDRLGFNYVRNWIIWSTGSGTAAPPNRVAFPMPFERTGPGEANDAGLKFDLQRFDEAFFQRLHDRAHDLQQHGVYLSVMLFEPYGFLGGEDVQGQRLWDGNLFHAANNVNGIDIDRNHNGLGEEFFTLQDPAVVAIQKAYLEKMVDSLGDLDNVFWEISNEPPAGSIAWQLAMLQHLRTYEAGKLKQHLILMSPGGWKPGGWSQMPEKEITDSPADCIATAAGWIKKDNPKVYPPKKPVLFDLDHVSPGSTDPSLIWKAFTRGYHFCLYDHPFERPETESVAWEIARRNVTLTCLAASQRDNIALLSPREDLSSTGFCLAEEGRQYIVYAERQEEFGVRGLQMGRQYQMAWIDVDKAELQPAALLTAADPTQRFTPPCAGAVLLLALEDDSPGA